MSSKPAIVLATGSFATPDLYTNILEPLRSLGYSVAAPTFATVGRKPGTKPTLYDDAALVAAEAEKFADQGKDVVLVAHSYGGAVATQAAKGLVKADREKEGKKGGVVRLAYITSLVPGEGEPASPMAGEKSDAFNVTEDGWMELANLERSAARVFNHQPPEKGLEMISRFSTHFGLSFLDKLTYAGYKYVPSSWLFCEEDQTVSPEYQEGAIKRIEAATGKKVDVTRGNWDHCPSFEDPEYVVNWIVGVAGKGGEWE